MSRIWTKEEDNILREMYPNLITSNLLEFLPGRTISSITGHAHVLQVFKSKSFYDAGLGGRISLTNKIGLGTQFVNNYPGWNKGKKQSEYMTPDQIEKTKKTRFQPGQDPHNTVAMGSERVSKDGYVEIKIKHTKGQGSSNNFESKHRLIYQENFGPIPPGMIVEFLDGNKTNFSADNLVLATRRENLLRNTMCDQSIVKRFLGVNDPVMIEKIIKEIPEIIDLKRNALKLNKKINEHYGC